MRPLLKKKVYSALLRQDFFKLCDIGVLHLCTKTVERSHMPAKLWRRIELSSKYDEALEQIDQSLRYWYDRTFL
ncbi:MAG: hypothetical protein CMB73_05425 [Euryarchaeota archaeon]|jgi:hypothetical protein|nr:hypothetical protein [Euryarchaeota archaeon]